MKIHHALAGLSEQRNRVVEPLMAEYPVPYAIVIGTLRAGDWPSSVPDRLVAHGRMGLRVDEDPHDARGELENWLSATAADDVYLRDHPPVVRWSGGQYAGGRMPEGHGLRGLVADAHSDAHCDVRRGTQGRERGVPYGSDLRLYAGAGVPTVHYGPGDAQLAHGPEESVDLDEVVAVTRALALTAIRSCGTR